MNIIPPEEREALVRLFDAGVGTLAAARKVGCNKNTASRYRRKWIEAELQRAYDVLWEGEAEACDEITARLPEKDVLEMLNDWLNDQCGQEPKSKWY